MAKAKARTAQEAAQDVAVEEQAVETIVIEIPVVREPCPRGEGGPVHININMQAPRDRVCRRGAWALMRALDERGDRLPSGRRVVSSADAMRWVMSQISAQLDGQPET